MTRLTMCTATGADTAPCGTTTTSTTCTTGNWHSPHDDHYDEHLNLDHRPGPGRSPCPRSGGGLLWTTGPRGRSTAGAGAPFARASAAAWDSCGLALWRCRASSPRVRGWTAHREDGRFRPGDREAARQHGGVEPRATRDRAPCGFTRPATIRSANIPICQPVSQPLGLVHVPIGSVGP